MRTIGTPKQLAQRRRRAVQLVKQGHTQSAVAAALMVHRSSVSRWYAAYAQHGVKALRAKPTPGRPPRLSGAQKETLVAILLRGPLAAGCVTECWTLKRIGRVIFRHFHIRYHPSHIWRLMCSLGWSCQRPEPRAKQRKPKSIKNWKRSAWPRTKKNHRRQAGTYVI